MAWRDMAGPIVVSTQPVLGEAPLQVEVPAAEPARPKTQIVVELDLQALTERLDQLIQIETAILAHLRQPTVWQRLAAVCRRYWERLKAA